MSIQSCITFCTCTNQKPFHRVECVRVSFCDVTRVPVQFSWYIENLFVSCVFVSVSSRNIEKKSKICDRRRKIPRVQKAGTCVCLQADDDSAASRKLEKKTKKNCIYICTSKMESHFAEGTYSRMYNFWLDFRFGIFGENILQCLCVYMCVCVWNVELIIAQQCARRH